MYNYASLDPTECEFLEIAGIDELPNGERMFIEVDEQTIVIFNIAGEMYAIADLCSHDDGPVGEGDVVGFEIACPRHGARFDLRTGAVLSLPAIVDIPAYPVKVENGLIFIGLPMD